MKFLQQMQSIRTNEISNYLHIKPNESERGRVQEAASCVQLIFIQILNSAK